MMERRYFLKFTTGAALSGALAACGGGGASGPSGNPPIPTEPVRTRVVVGWNNVVLAAIRASRTAPPMAARALAIVHTAMYDAWAAYDKVGSAPASAPPSAGRWPNSFPPMRCGPSASPLTLR